MSLRTLSRRDVAIIASAFVVLVLSGALFIVFTQPPPYPLPEGGINVTLPAAPPYTQLTTGNWNDRYPIWSPNGSLIAYISDKSGLWSVWVMQASGTAAKQVSKPEELAMYPEWSPDSSSISYWFFDGAVSGYEVVNLTTLGITRITTNDMTAFQVPAEWSPDGSHLAFFISSLSPQLIVYDMKTGSTSPMTSVNGPMLAASWVSNSELVYSSYYNGSNCIMWVSLLTGKTGLLIGGAHNFIAPSVGPNGTMAYYSDFNPAKDSLLLQGSSGYDVCLPAHGDYSYCVFIPLNETSYDVWLSGVDGSNATFQSKTAFSVEGGNPIAMVPYVPGTIELASPPEWSPDGTKVAYAASSSLLSSVYVWNTVSGSVNPLGPVQGGTFSLEPAWSPDGLNVAFACNMTGTYHIWVVSTSGTGEPQKNIGSGY